MKLWILFKSSSPLQTANFYEKLGLVWKEVQIEDSKYLIAKASNISFTLSLTPVQTPSTEIMFSGIDNNAFESLNNKNDPEGRTVRLLSKKWDDLEIVTTSFKSIVLILRSQKIQEVKDFYNSLGNWVLEKHGNGPEHYALEKDWGVVEIYPKRIKLKNNIEFFIESENDLSELKSISLEKDKLLLADPDNRILNINLKLKNVEHTDKEEKNSTRIQEILDAGPSSIKASSQSSINSNSIAHK